MTHTPLPLSPSQLRVARLAHLSIPEIATALGLGQRTTKAHIDAARARLGVKHKRHLPQALRDAGLWEEEK